MLNRTTWIGLCLCLMLGFHAKGQTLNPSIGISGLPADSDPICNIPPFYSLNYDSVGYQLGETVPDFTFYTPAGTPVTLSDELDTPVLLISGSYTCTRFRNSKPSINTINADYQGQLKVLIVYIVEPHPVIDSSPYNPGEWLTLANLNANLLYRQPTTYGERKALIADMQDSLSYHPPILVDGPCNEWWLNYGQGPHRSYLINTDGTVFFKQDWYQEESLIEAIDSLLLVQNQEELEQQFEVEIYPNPGPTLTVEIVGESPPETATFQLFGIDGRLLFSYSLSAGKNQLQVDELPSGMYHYSISTQGNVKTGTWVKI